MNQTKQEMINKNIRKLFVQQGYKSVTMNTMAGVEVLESYDNIAKCSKSYMILSFYLKEMNFRIRSSHEEREVDKCNNNCQLHRPEGRCL